MMAELVHPKLDQTIFRHTGRIFLLPFVSLSLSLFTDAENLNDY